MTGPDEHEPPIHVKADGRVLGSICFNRLVKWLGGLASGLALLVAATLISAAGAQIDKLNDLNRANVEVTQQLVTLAEAVTTLTETVERNRREAREDQKDVQDLARKNAEAISALVGERNRR